LIFWKERWGGRYIIVNYLEIKI